MWAGLLRAMRPHQWVKNIFVLAPLVFAQELFITARALSALAGMGLFCIASSTVYIFNDLASSSQSARSTRSARPGTPRAPA
jgi:4-hydroxybenzoate polyprenyltransferase